MLEKLDDYFEQFFCQSKT